MTLQGKLITSASSLLITSPGNTQRKHQAQRRGSILSAEGLDRHSIFQCQFVRVLGYPLLGFLFDLLELPGEFSDLSLGGDLVDMMTLGLCAVFSCHLLYLRMAKHGIKY